MALEEEKKTAKSYVEYKFWRFWLFLFGLLILSVGIASFLLSNNAVESEGLASYTDYFFVSPFSHNKISQYYFHHQWYYPIIFLFVAILVRLFFFGNPKKKYIKKLEKVKRVVLDFIPFYFDGKDPRNNYIRFGMEKSLRKGFLERTISPGKYVKKVRFLNIFTGDCSPDLVLNLKGSYIKNAFINEDYYMELFRIIEGYVKDNIDTYLNIPLKDYRAIGTDIAKWSNDSIKTFIKIYVPEGKHGSFKWTKKEAIKKFDEEIKKKGKKEKKRFIYELLKNKPQLYFNHINKMVIMSPLAMKEFIASIEKDAQRFLLTNIKLRTDLIYKMNEYKKINYKKMIEIMKFVTFFKLINYFMGLPSGIVTARVEDYTLSRIVDDIEIFEKNTAIRQIKKGINDKLGKFNDTEARAYMIFHHEYFLNSRNSKKIKEIFERFDALVNVDNEEGQEGNEIKSIEIKKEEG